MKLMTNKAFKEAVSAEVEKALNKRDEQHYIEERNRRIERDILLLEDRVRKLETGSIANETCVPCNVR